MAIYMSVMFFVIGTVLGSFYNVVGYRLPRNESIIYPPSHCPNCNHRLKPLELLPIISFIIQRGKCTSCHKKIAWYYPLFEGACGLLFMLSYLLIGYNYELIIALTFLSMLIIIMVSDYYYMIISDEVLIFFGIALIIEKALIYGISTIPSTIFNGVIAFIIMFLLKKFGDFLFKKESMGGGDIKLMFIFGLVLGWPNALASIVIGSVIGLPISMVILTLKRSHVIPFGPFLAMGAIVMVLGKLDIINLIDVLTR